MALKIDEVRDLVFENVNAKIDEMHQLMISMADHRQKETMERSGPRFPQTTTGQASMDGGPYADAEQDENYPLSLRSTPELMDAEWHIVGTASSATSISTSKPMAVPRVRTEHPSPPSSPATRPRQLSIRTEEPRTRQAYLPVPGTTEASRPGSPAGASQHARRARSNSSLGTSLHHKYSDASLTPAPLSVSSTSLHTGTEIPISPWGSSSGLARSERGLSPRPASLTDPERQHEAFKKALWRNATTLCEVKGMMVEYLCLNQDTYANVMVRACRRCQVYLVQRYEPQSNGDDHYSVSIWALSDDRQVRFQQTLPDEERIVPYTVWDNATKVTLRVKSVVKLHGRTYTDRPTSTAQSSWVEYNFQDEQAAGTFQTALMGKTLLMTIPTNKTIRVTGGLKGSLSMQEQMCALENLRIWREHDTQGVLAMIHFTPHYRDGYLIFYLNTPNDLVQVCDKGNRLVKIKNVNVVDGREGGAGKLASRTSSVAGSSTASSKAKSERRERKEAERRITALRIEFTTEEGKMDFMKLVGRAQENLPTFAPAYPGG